jgi:hypothetical protein
MLVFFTLQPFAIWLTGDAPVATMIAAVIVGVVALLAAGLAASLEPCLPARARGIVDRAGQQQNLYTGVFLGVDVATWTLGLAAGLGYVPTLSAGAVLGTVAALAVTSIHSPRRGIGDGDAPTLPGPAELA